MTTVNLYYCHSPICAHLALKQAEAVGDAERHVFITARNTPFSHAVFSLQKDVFGTRQDFMVFLRSISAFIDGLCAQGEHLRVFVPHAAGLPTRVILCHKRVNSVYFMEEGSAYYVPAPDEYALVWPDYIAKFNLTQQDLVEITHILGRPVEEIALVVRSLCENFRLFHDVCGRAAGLLVTDESALEFLSNRKALHVIVRPLAPIFNVQLERMALFMLPPHHSAMTQHDAALENVMRINKEKIRALLMIYEKVVLKPHPSDSYFWLDIVQNYLISPEVITYDQLRLTGPDGQPFEGEPSVLNFGGFYVGQSSALIYVTRLWGAGRVIDRKLVVPAGEGGQRLLERPDNMRDIQYSFPSAFVMMPGLVEPVLASMLDAAGLQPTHHASLEKSGWPVLPGGTYRLVNGTNCSDFVFPQSSAVFFVRSLRDCLCGIIHALLSHDYGPAAPPITRNLLACADDSQRMQLFLAEMGEAFIKQNLFGPMVKFLFRPGVIKLCVPETDAPDRDAIWRETVLKIQRHLNLPIVDMPSTAPDKVQNTPYHALRTQYWSDEAEVLFAALGGDKIQAFYDFEKDDLNALRDFVGHWVLVDKVVIHILPNGSVMAQTGHLGRAFASRNGDLVVAWDTVPHVYYMRFNGSDGASLSGWTNHAADISAVRW